MLVPTLAISRRSATDTDYSILTARSPTPPKREHRARTMRSKDLVDPGRGGIYRLPLRHRSKTRGLERLPLVDYCPYLITRVQTVTRVTGRAESSYVPRVQVNLKKITGQAEKIKRI
jgi:hypothetical protein